MNSVIPRRRRRRAKLEGRAGSPPHSNLTKSFVTFRVSVSVAAAVADSGPFHSLATGGVAYTNTGGRGGSGQLPLPGARGGGEDGFVKM